MEPPGGGSGWHPVGPAPWPCRRASLWALDGSGSLTHQGLLGSPSPGVKPTARGDQDLPKAEPLTQSGPRETPSWARLPSQPLSPSPAWSEASWLGLAPCPGLCPTVGVETARMTGMGGSREQRVLGQKSLCSVPFQAENVHAQASCIQHHRYPPGNTLTPHPCLSPHVTWSRKPSLGAGLLEWGGAFGCWPSPHPIFLVCALPLASE